jgi:hypothetical protein
MPLIVSGTLISSRSSFHTNQIGVQIAPKSIYCRSGIMLICSSMKARNSAEKVERTIGHTARKTAKLSKSRGGRKDVSKAASSIKGAYLRR